MDFEKVYLYLSKLKQQREIKMAGQWSVMNIWELTIETTAIVNEQSWRLKDIFVTC